MLTQNDIQKIKSVVQTETRKLDQRVASLDQRVASFQDETRKNFRRLEKKVNHADKFLDKEIMADRKRIGKIEESLNLESLSG